MSLPSRLAAAVALLVVGVGPILSLFAPMGVAPLVGALGLAALIDRLARGHPWSAPTAPAPYLFAALALLGALSALWSIAPGESLGRGLRLLLELVLGGALMLWAMAPASEDNERRLRVLTWTLVGGLLAAAALAWLDHFTHGAALSFIKGRKVLSTTGNRGATVMVALLAPALLLLWRARHPWIAGLTAAAVLSAVHVLESDAAKLALMVGAVGAVGGWALRRWAGPIAAGVIALAVLFAPAPALLMGDHPPEGIKPSGAHRLLIWRFAGTKLVERPVFGWGLEASRALPGGKELVSLRGPDGGLIQGESMPLHPHNGPLQIWVELGAVGAILAALALVCTVLSAGRLAQAWGAPGIARAAVFGGIAATLVIAALSYGVWQSWWMWTLLLAAALTRRALTPPPSVQA